MKKLLKAALLLAVGLLTPHLSAQESDPTYSGKATGTVKDHNYSFNYYVTWNKSTDKKLHIVTEFILDPAVDATPDPQITCGDAEQYQKMTAVPGKANTYEYTTETVYQEEGAKAPLIWFYFVYGYPLNAAVRGDTNYSTIGESNSSTTDPDPGTGDGGDQPGTGVTYTGTVTGTCNNALLDGESDATDQRRDISVTLTYSATWQEDGSVLVKYISCTPSVLGFVAQGVFKDGVQFFVNNEYTYPGPYKSGETLEINFFCAYNQAATNIIAQYIVGSTNDGGDTPTEPNVPTSVPTPEQSAENVFSVFSSFTNSVNFAAENWGAGTPVEENIGGAKVEKVTGFAYFGYRPSAAIDVSDYDYLHVDYWPMSQSALFIKLESDGKSQEVAAGETTTMGAWNSYDIALSKFSPVDLEAVTIIVPSASPTGGTAYLANIYFWKEGSTDNPEPPVADAPTMVPTPTLPNDEVFSILSKGYNNQEFSVPNWGQTTKATQVSIDGATIYKLENFNFVGWQLESNENVSAYNTVHVDYWTTADNSQFRVKLVSPGEGNEEEWTAPAVAVPNQWNDYNIPMSYFTSGKFDASSLFQLVFSSLVSPIDNAYIANVYFYNSEDTQPEPDPEVQAPTTVPTPSQEAADVLSIFGSAYTDAVTPWFEEWGSGTKYEKTEIAGKTVAKVSDFTYFGWQIYTADEANGAFDVSTCDYMHVDYWTPDGTSFAFVPISRTNGASQESALYEATVKQKEWNSYDVPLSDFSALNPKTVWQIKFANGGGSTGYIANVYFYKSSSETPEQPGDDESTGKFSGVFENAKYVGSETTEDIPYEAIYSVEWDETSGAIIVKVQITPNNVTGLEAHMLAPDFKGNFTYENGVYSFTLTGDYKKDDVVNFTIHLPYAGGVSQIPVTYKVGSSISGGDMGGDEPGQDTGDAPTTVPTPTQAAADVLSIFGSAYTDAVTPWFEEWGSGTKYEKTEIAGKTVAKVSDFTYFGWQIYTADDANGAFDVSTCNYMHVDYWTPDGTSFAFAPISRTNGATQESALYEATVKQKEWNSYDVPLSDFSALNPKTVWQIKFANGEGATGYITNVYFYKGEPTSEQPGSNKGNGKTYNDELTGAYGSAFLTGETDADAREIEVKVNYGITWLESDGNLLVRAVVEPANVVGLVVKMFNYTPGIDAYQGDFTNNNGVFTLTMKGTFTEGEVLPLGIELACAGTGTTLKFDYTVGSEKGEQYVPDDDEGETGNAPTFVPTPPYEADDVVSVYSAAYKPATTFYVGGWGQTTQYSEVEVDGTKVYYLTNFNYLGWELNAGQYIDVSDCDYMHVDYWTPDGTTFTFTPISPDPTAEKGWNAPSVVKGQWNSYDAPLTYFSAAGVNLKNIFQIKFDNGGGATGYIANVYFFKGEPMEKGNGNVYNNTVEGVYTSALYTGANDRQDIAYTIDYAITWMEDMSLKVVANITPSNITGLVAQLSLGNGEYVEAQQTAPAGAKLLADGTVEESSTYTFLVEGPFSQGDTPYLAFYLSYDGGASTAEVEGYYAGASREMDAINSAFADDVEMPVEFYNLQGVRVDNPSAGIYIRRQGNSVSKVIIR